MKKLTGYFLVCGMLIAASVPMPNAHGKVEVYCKNPACTHAKSVHQNGGGMCFYFDGCDHFIK